MYKTSDSLLEIKANHISKLYIYGEINYSLMYLVWEKAQASLETSSLGLELVTEGNTGERRCILMVYSPW